MYTAKMFLGSNPPKFSIAKVLCHMVVSLKKPLEEKAYKTNYSSYVLYCVYLKRECSKDSYVLYILLSNYLVT